MANSNLTEKLTKIIAETAEATRKECATEEFILNVAASDTRAAIRRANRTECRNRLARGGLTVDGAAFVVKYEF